MKKLHSLRIDAESGAIQLSEPPEDVLGCLVDVRAAGVLWEVLLQGDFRQFGLELRTQEAKKTSDL